MTGNVKAITEEEITPFIFTQALRIYGSGTRFIPYSLMLAIAGSFTMKGRKEVIEPIKAQGPLFVSVLVVMIFLLTTLTFFPFIVIGPFSM